MRFLRQILVQNEVLAVSTLRTDDLPVNPLSMILVTLRNLNNSVAAVDYTTVQNLLTQIAKLEILYKGSAIVSGSLADLARYNAYLLGNVPAQTFQSIVDNDARSVTIPILLGRRPFWPNECFPAVRRGELQIQLTSAAAQTGVDTLTVQIETVELLDAKPTQFLKYTTIAKTPSATGDHDTDLPIGNKIAHAMLFGTTAPTGASLNASITQLRLLIDNVEAYYARSNWETLHNEMQRRVQEGVQASPHNHLENTAGAYAQNALTDRDQAVLGFFDNYALLDFDPNTDDNFLLDTVGRARIHLRINAGVADAIRIIPAELIQVQQAGISPTP
jgi:hypothetical protein